MINIKKGDIVGRKSYGKDIYFIVDKIIKIKPNNEIAILKGLNIRIIADSLISDLEKITKKEIINSIQISEIGLEDRIKNNNTCKNFKRQKIYTGKILHLDGDKKYSEKIREK